MKDNSKRLLFIPIVRGLLNIVIFEKENLHSVTYIG